MLMLSRKSTRATTAASCSCGPAAKRGSHADGVKRGRPEDGGVGGRAWAAQAAAVLKSEGETRACLDVGHSVHEAAAVQAERVHDADRGEAHRDRAQRPQPRPLGAALGHALHRQQRCQPHRAHAELERLRAGQSSQELAHRLRRGVGARDDEAEAVLELRQADHDGRACGEAAQGARVTARRGQSRGRGLGLQEVGSRVVRVEGARTGDVRTPAQTRSHFGPSQSAHPSVRASVLRPPRLTR